jgi:amino acid transporter
MCTVGASSAQNQRETFDNALASGFVHASLGLLDLYHKSGTIGDGLFRVLTALARMGPLGCVSVVLAMQARMLYEFAAGTLTRSREVGPVLGRVAVATAALLSCCCC